MRLKNKRIINCENVDFIDNETLIINHENNKILFSYHSGFIINAGFGRQNKKPNVLFIAVDGLNNWNNILRGHPQAKTPNYVKLASKGLIFSVI